MSQSKRVPILAVISVGILLDHMECSAAASVLINEVNADTPENPEITEYVELWNSDSCSQSLSKFRIALYNGKDRIYKDIDLSDYCIPGNGAFVIGGGSVNPRPDLVIQGQTWLQNGNDVADAVAMYWGKDSGKSHTVENLKQNIFLSLNEKFEI